MEVVYILIYANAMSLGRTGRFNGQAVVTVTPIATRKSASWSASLVIWSATWQPAAIALLKKRTEEDCVHYVGGRGDMGSWATRSKGLWSPCTACKNHGTWLMFSLYMSWNFMAHRPSMGTWESADMMASFGLFTQASRSSISTIRRAVQSEYNPSPTSAKSTILANPVSERRCYDAVKVLKQADHKKWV
jgi:hypothetical protein